MEDILYDIIKAVRTHGPLSPAQLNRILAAHNAAAYAHIQTHGGAHTTDGRTYAKRQLAPFYLEHKKNNSPLWQSWNIDDTLHKHIIASIQMKPRRSASGVATITVITKPYMCKGACAFCPNDVRMPKSYMANEPACQRAERNFFDPLLQVASRLKALHEMGHSTSKIELIVLGGTFADYSNTYQQWFIAELFFALNHFNDADFDIFVQERRKRYEVAGIQSSEEALSAYASMQQSLVATGKATYNQAIQVLYGDQSAWQEASIWQVSSMDEVVQQHTLNENAAHRVVGLVIETRPNTISIESLKLLRALGCTKLQVGVQTLNEDIAARSKRPTPLADIRKAFEYIRLFGFKSHAHFMVNLPGATPDGDKADYEAFVSDAAIAPDETKLYPCVLLAHTELEHMYKDGTWQPYEEDVLVDILAHDVLVTPEHMRISRMIRDFSAPDIVAGTKKTNLRQMVEQHVQKRVLQGAQVKEIRMREIATSQIEPQALHLDIHTYETTNTDELFLQWIAPKRQIAGFLRLSLPKQTYVNSIRELHPHIPICQGDAMIREVHIYGSAASFEGAATGAQHAGLGKALIAKAQDIARERGYERLNVISAIGTRQYYRNLGFADNNLYQTYTL